MATPLSVRLAEYNKSNQTGVVRGLDVGKILLGSYKSLIDLIANLDSPAIVEPTSTNKDRQPLTHRRLRQFVTEAVDMVGSFGVRKGERVAILAPNGPEVAVCYSNMFYCFIYPP